MVPVRHSLRHSRQYHPTTRLIDTTPREHHRIQQHFVVNEAMPTNVAVHTISFRGTAGAIFILLVAATVSYVIGFATTGWRVYRGSHSGLWESCSCGPTGDDDWLRAVQAMIVIGLIGLVIAFILISLYMCVHTISKNSTILALVIVCFLAVVFMVIGFAIYGSKMDHLNWSFALAVIGAILAFIAGVLSIVQMRESGVRV